MQSPPRSNADSAGQFSEDEFAWIEPGRFTNWTTARHHLEAIWNCGAPTDLLTMLRERLLQQLASLVDFDATISNLDRFIAASRSPTSLLALFERDEKALSTLLQVFSTSQTLANRLIADPESFDLLRASDGQPAERAYLVDELVAELATIESPSRAALAIRKFSSRETARIAYGEFVSDMSPEHVGEQLAFVADAILEAALAFTLRRIESQSRTPMRSDGQSIKFAIIGLGQLGGTEMGYGSPLEIMFLYDAIEEKSESHRTYVEQVVSDVIALTDSEETAALSIRVDHSFRPLGEAYLIGSGDLIAKRLESDGRTWQRVEMIKARVVAGDQGLGNDLIQRLQPWIYRRFMSRRDFGDIRSLRKKLQRRFESGTVEGDDVYLAPGGRRDVELMMRFLQLLHGGEISSVRVGNTYEAIASLEREGCLTHQESSLLTRGYARLCRLQHLLSVMTGQHTRCLPHDESMRRRLAWHLGVRGDDGTVGDLSRFQSQLQETFELNRKVLNHLMVDAPKGDDGDELEDYAAETELVLDPAPDEELVRQTLIRHSLTDIDQAMVNIRALSTESVRFLSRRRCHHFFASLAPKLLAEIAKTPDPDRTLQTLAEVADSLGGKSSLWELLNTNRATLELMVRMCAATPYLSDLLIEMPGMIDELIDSLLMNRLPSADRLDAKSIDLCRRATDIDVVLHGFKSSAHLMIGVHDILGKESLEDLLAALGDAAEAALRRTIEFEQEQLAARFGDPVDADGEPADLIAVAIGKFGGHEPNYRSDLDVVFLYTDEGETRRRVGGPRKTVSNAQFFNMLTKAVVRRINEPRDFGQLYELDRSLRPAGEEGVLAVSLDQFAIRFRRGIAPLWQQMALCKARAVSGGRRKRAIANELLRSILKSAKWRPAMLGELETLRMRIQETSSDENIKSGVGGTIDIEFIAQMLTLANIAEHGDSILATGTLASLEQLAAAGVLDATDAATLAKNYRMLRGIEANLCLMKNEARHELPLSDSGKRDLAYLMHRNDHRQIDAELDDVRQSTRQIFERLFASS
ncbi:glutamate-ammonia-ligase adenylyltransferase [Roseiconus lacunae]|uniref:Glutamate-ammonia-ligase adenylyltransferase n=1 Tax=Roseiconus lacunae TaxID=2605694 RepID=A0ABT7PHW0_9BACT|nr:glutamate-ammonia-ligase adenylyltransferase [Roseiconus lacunae]MDM4016089.1 glutamate-ammonia-ligase adenylyltransferase [Roseiconus lacunae]